MSNEPLGFEQLERAPAPVPAARVGRLRALGAGLLGIALLASGWDWTQTSGRATAYHAGVAAVAAQHPIAAATAFAAAGGYADAPARAEHAAAQVGRLAVSYAALQAAAGRGDWVAAYRAAQAVAALQPDYRDIAAQLVVTHRRLRAAGTAGLIYLQSGGATPGLYLYAADGSLLHLPGSTGHSRVPAVAADRFVYDTAQGVMLATRPAVGPPLFTPLPPAFTRNDTLWLTAAGLWRSGPTGAIGFYGHNDMGVPYYAAVPATVGLTRWVAAAAPAAVLLADTGLGTGTPATHLLRLTAVPSADGRSGWPAVAADLPGFLLTADLSPDGRYAVVQTEEATAGITRTLYLLDFMHPTDPPRVFAQLTWQGVPAAARLQADFLPGSNGLSDGLLVERNDGTGLILARYSLPSGGLRGPLWSAPDSGDLREQWAVLPDGQGIAFRAGAAAHATLVWLSTAGDAGPQSRPFPLLPGQAADWWVAPAGTALLGRVRNPDGADKGTTEALYALSLPLPAEIATPRLLAGARRVYDPRYPAFALPATGLLAAVISPAGDLAAYPFDGSPATPLACDVDAVWALP